MAATPLLLKHPSDRGYAEMRDGGLRDISTLKHHELKQRLQHQMNQPTPEVSESDRNLSAKMVGELRTSPYVPDRVKAILDSTSGTTGNVLIRQDLEITLYRLFVDRFPGWERLKKTPANGLTHAFNQVTNPNSGAALFSTVLATELTGATAARSNFVQKTAPVAVFATLRGASFKELAAVRQGGVAYDVLGTELAKQHWPRMVA